MKFWHNPTSNIEELTLKLNQISIPLVSNTKFLGVSIDNKLNWNEHINNIISKISVNKNLIGRSRNLLSTQPKNAFTMLISIPIWHMQLQYGVTQ